MTTENLKSWSVKFKTNFSLLHKRAVMWGTTGISFIVAVYAQLGAAQVTAMMTAVAEILHIPLSVVPLLIPVVVAIFAAWPQPKLAVAVESAKAEQNKS